MERQSAGAQVNVTFFMPAMPAMGMGAMKTSVELCGQRRRTV